MLHNNFRNFISQLMCTADSSNASNYTYTNTDGDEGITALTTSCAANNKGFNPFHYNSKNNAQIANKKRSQILSETNSGSSYSCAKLVSLIGNAVENENNYTLGEFINDDAVLYSTANTYMNRISAVTTIYNQSNASITFNEIGLIWKPVGYMSNKFFLLVKEILEEPIIIPSGESIIISFNIFGNTAEVEVT